MNNVLYPSFPGSSPGRPIDTTGGGGNFDDMEARVAKLESDVAHIQRDASDIKTDLRDLRKDVRRLIYFVIGGFVVLLSMMATGYVRLDDRIATSVSVSEARTAARLDKIDTKLDKIIDRYPATFGK